MVHYLENKRFPTTEEGLKALTTNKYILKDVWGNEHVYIYPAKYGNKDFDLYSIGVNGKDDFGEIDDITNWKSVNHEYYGGTSIKTRIIFYCMSALFFILISFLIILQILFRISL